LTQFFGWDKSLPARSVFLGRNSQTPATPILFLLFLTGWSKRKRPAEVLSGILSHLKGFGNKLHEIQPH
jgi:hypothetical protein